MRCVSPWYNHTGWLGVKHQLTYLLTLCAEVQFGRRNHWGFLAETPIESSQTATEWGGRGEGVLAFLFAIFPCIYQILIPLTWLTVLWWLHFRQRGCDWEWLSWTWPTSAPVSSSLLSTAGSWLFSSLRSCHSSSWVDTWKSGFWQVLPGATRLHLKKLERWGL